MRQPPLISDDVLRCMRPEDRAALGVETFEEADARGRAEDAVESEKVLQSACEGYLRREDTFCLHLSCRAREKAGAPDLMFAWHGVPMAIELKSRTGRLSAVQVSTLAQMERNGWETAVCRSYTEFQAVLAAAEKANKGRRR